MQERRKSTVAVSFLQGVPGLKLVSIFKEAFRAHPVASLNEELTREFLSAFARSATFLVAYDPAIGVEVGFAVGGVAAVLDRTRAHFIRRNGWRLAGCFLGRRLSVRILLARVRVRRPIPGSPYTRYQLRFIAVAPQARGMGIGTMLLAAFERTLPLGTAYHAWTLEGPRGAEQFYLGNGFKRGTNVNGHIRMWKHL
jgi:GNAT superfamily N-acetyltransferase